jgi:Protein of unknown function (DUF3604)
MMRGWVATKVTLTALALNWAVNAFADTTHPESVNSGYSPYANQDFPNQLYWGDTHVHTNLSADAYGFGNSLTPEDAYRFARGATITSNSGQPARLRRPLDFLVISDHAEFLGVSSLLDSNSEQLNNSAIGQRWLKLLKEGKSRQIMVEGKRVNVDQKLQILLDSSRASMGELEISHDESVSTTIWHQVARTADQHNDPGTFTAFIGYEWSSLPGGNNLHRNVIFRDGFSRVKDILPFSAIDSQNPEDLWRYLDSYEALTGGRVMAIPHNGNISNGLMYSDSSYAGEPMTTSYAQTRARWEPVIEVTQIKGDAETHPYLSPDDTFADFETWDDGNFGMPKIPKTNSMLQYEYARSTFKNGLKLEQKLGANPFKFGMIGSTDTHVAMSAVEENNYFGKFSVDEPSPGRTHSEPMAAARYVASGYAGVWARENTREALFDAMQRREIYATTGPRITVRLFGGWHFDHLDAQRPDYAAIGYQKGVPMGGDLDNSIEGRSPGFLVVASKDAEGANLDRVQIIKGWLDANGNAREKVYDVALSDDRVVSTETGRAPALKSTVNIATASYTNTIGDAQLAAVWEDPDFNPAQPSFYYARVLEIPTPRWSTYDAAFYGVELSEKVPAEIQERAYTSPIWYTP